MAESRLPEREKAGESGESSRGGSCWQLVQLVHHLQATLFCYLLVERCSRYIVNKVNDLIRDITEEQDDELLAELKRLEMDLDESIFEKDRVEKTVPCPRVLSTSPPSHPASDGDKGEVAKAERGCLANTGASGVPQTLTVL
ncbi:hypothetical protein INR49_025095 [Caranx melampygus]|nr:hypothetical protein INR49_025095 [Caranx melampygus]